jgi:hypothetical protein
VRLILETWTTGYSIPSPALDLAADRAAALYDGAVRDDAVRSGRVGGRAYFAPTAVRPGLSAREAGVTPALARPHDQVYFHLPLSIAPFVWRPRTSPSHGENRGSSPLGSANDFNNLLTAHQERKTVCLFFVYYQLRESIISSENKSEVVGITAPLHSSVC